MIFPEGTCTNRSCLITFKPGIFKVFFAHFLFVLAALLFGSFFLYQPYQPAHRFVRFSFLGSLVLFSVRKKRPDCRFFFLFSFFCPAGSHSALRFSCKLSLSHQILRLISTGKNKIHFEHKSEDDGVPRQFLALGTKKDAEMIEKMYLKKKN